MDSKKLKKLRKDWKEVLDKLPGSSKATSYRDAFSNPTKLVYTDKVEHFTQSIFNQYKTTTKQEIESFTKMLTQANINKFVQTILVDRFAYNLSNKAIAKKYSFRGGERDVHRVVTHALNQIKKYYKEKDGKSE